MNKRKSVYDQLNPICTVERKHNGFLLHFGERDKVRVNNSREARQEALRRAQAYMARPIGDDDSALMRANLQALITELENYLEEYAA